MKIPENYTLYLPRDQIEERIFEMSREISTRFDPMETSLVGILGGALFFMADLTRHLDPSYHLDYLSLSSYHGAKKSSGRVTIHKDITFPCNNRNILILDDILDSGLTLSFAEDHLKSSGAKSVESAVLLAKERHRRNSFATLVGFFVPEYFYIGYGLDIEGRFRGLRDIYMGEKTNV